MTVIPALVSHFTLSLLMNESYESPDDNSLIVLRRRAYVLCNEISIATADVLSFDPNLPKYALVPGCV